MERGKHFLWPSDPVSADWKWCLGTYGGTISFCKGVQPGSWLLRIQTIYAVQNSVVREIQHEGRLCRSYWRDPETQGTSVLCGTVAIHSKLLCTDGFITASCMWGRRRALPFLRFPEVERHPTWKSKSGLAEWLHHQGQPIPQELPTDPTPPRQVQQDIFSKYDAVQRKGVRARR